MTKNKGGQRPGAGRPNKEINWADIELAAEQQWNQQQLAALAGCDVKTLLTGIERHFGIEYSVYLEQKRALGWAKLRSKQYELALEGSVPLLIWLGKNYLGQTDKQQLNQEISGSITGSLNLKNLSDGELKAFDALIKKASSANTHQLD